MKVKDLIKLLSECDPETDVVDQHFWDVVRIREDKVLAVLDDELTTTQQVVLEIDD